MRLSSSRPAELRNPQVGQDDVDGILFENFQGLFGGGRQARAQARLGHYLMAQVARGIFVVHDQHGDRRRPIHRQSRTRSACRHCPPFFPKCPQLPLPPTR